MQFVRRPAPGAMRRTGVASALLALTALAACAAADQPRRTAPDPAPLKGPTYSSSPSTTPQPGKGPAQSTRPDTRPNIVLVLMDDFSMDLVQTMKSMRIMKRKGASYSHAFAVDSLCCVSRSSTFTGQLPHQTGVLTNTSGTKPGAPLGGWAAFQEGGNPDRSFNVALQQAGYTTGFVGKYLNEYEWVPGRSIPPIVPGWSQFNVVFGSAYDGWGYGSTYLDDGHLRVLDHPAPPAWASAAVKDRAYAGTFIEDIALDFIKDHRGDDAPYFLEVAAYAPHQRTQPKPAYDGDPVFPPAFRDRASAGRPGNCGLVACSSLNARDLRGFRDDRSDNRPLTRKGRPAEEWNTLRNPFSRATQVKDLRDRAMMAQSVDRTVRRILKAVDDDTYVVFTSDNGLHLGQNGLGRGKGTAYDVDSHVPLYVVGPGVVPGQRAEVTANVDLAPTFEAMAGLTSPAYRVGQSLVPTFGDPALVRQNYAFIEHTAQALTRRDPDTALNGDELDHVPSYVAVRSRTALLIRYDFDLSEGTDHGYEFYTYKNRTWEKSNAFAAKRHQPEVKVLLGKLAAFDACADSRGGAALRPECRQLTR